MPFSHTQIIVCILIFITFWCLFTLGDWLFKHVRNVPFTRLVPALPWAFRNAVCFSHMPQLKAQDIYPLTTLTTLPSHCSFHKNSKCCASLIGTSLPALCPIHHLCLQMVSSEGQTSYKSPEKSQMRHTRIKKKKEPGTLLKVRTKKDWAKKWAKKRLEEHVRTD